jgi:hypothetical protein
MPKRFLLANPDMRLTWSNADETLDLIGPQRHDPADALNQFRLGCFLRFELEVAGLDFHAFTDLANLDFVLSFDIEGDATRCADYLEKAMHNAISRGYDRHQFDDGPRQFAIVIPGDDLSQYVAILNEYNRARPRQKPQA